ncbi:uncharacterized protein LOC108091145 [Drosophila ficusphila]|uniref:uncharacterized protein LOC108091145 n=1 Tax=Drosophila ficusphila TaxID=30025 RepID=UPI0007E7639D|nr:uncharacterized protein LOC108091145 [Drosophila ficusphila]
MNCVMCDVVTISPYSQEGSFSVCVCTREHYQCLCCDEDLRSRCGICAEKTRLIYVDLRFATEETEVASTSNSSPASDLEYSNLETGRTFNTLTLSKNSNKWNNHCDQSTYRSRRSKSVVTVECQTDSAQMRSNSVGRARQWHPEFPQAETYLKSEEDHYEEPGPRMKRLLQEESNKNDFLKSPLKYINNLEQMLLKIDKQIKEINYAEWNNTRKAADTEVQSSKESNRSTYNDLEQSKPEELQTCKEDNLEEDSLEEDNSEEVISVCHTATNENVCLNRLENSNKKTTVKYLDEYTAEEQRLLIGYPYKIRSSESSEYSAVSTDNTSEKEAEYPEEITPSSRFSQNTHVRPRVNEIQPNTTENKGVVLRFPSQKEGPTLYYRDNPDTRRSCDDKQNTKQVPTPKDPRSHQAEAHHQTEDKDIGNFVYFTAEQKDPAYGSLTLSKPLELLTSEPRKLNPSVLGNQISLVRRARFAGQNPLSWHSEKVPCPKNFVTDLVASKMEIGKVVLPVVMNTTDPLTKCPDPSCREVLYLWSINNHLVSYHRNWLVDVLELNQPRTFYFDLVKTNRKMRCHAVLQLRNVIESQGFVEQQNLLPVMIMSMQVPMKDIGENGGLDQRLTLVWASTLLSDSLPLKINLTLWPKAGNSPESIVSFTGSPYDFRQSWRPIKLIKSGRVIILTDEQVDNLTYNGKDLVGIQFFTMMGVPKADVNDPKPSNSD